MAISAKKGINWGLRSRMMMQKLTLGILVRAGLWEVIFKTVAGKNKGNQPHDEWGEEYVPFRGELLCWDLEVRMCLARLENWKMPRVTRR